MVTSNSDNDKLARIHVSMVIDNAVMPFTRWDYNNKVVIHDPSVKIGSAQVHRKLQFTLCKSDGQIMDETDSLSYAILWLIKD